MADTAVKGNVYSSVVSSNPENVKDSGKSTYEMIIGGVWRIIKQYDVAFNGNSIILKDEPEDAIERLIVYRNMRVDEDGTESIIKDVFLATCKLDKFGNVDFIGNPIHIGDYIAHDGESLCNEIDKESNTTSVIDIQWLLKKLTSAPISMTGLTDDKVRVIYDLHKFSLLVYEGTKFPKRSLLPLFELPDRCDKLELDVKNILPKHLMDKFDLTSEITWNGKKLNNLVLTNGVSLLGRYADRGNGDYRPLGIQDIYICLTECRLWDNYIYVAVVKPYTFNFFSRDTNGYVFDKVLSKTDFYAVPLVDDYLEMLDSFRGILSNLGTNAFSEAGVKTQQSAFDIAIKSFLTTLEECSSFVISGSVDEFSSVMNVSARKGRDYSKLIADGIVSSTNSGTNSVDQYYSNPSKAGPYFRGPHGQGSEFDMDSNKKF